MGYSNTISEECPHCNTQCQFKVIEQGHSKCTKDDGHHIPYICTNCGGGIMTKWFCNNNVELSTFRNNPSRYGQTLITYTPVVGDWKAKIDIDLITNIEVKADFKEAINCYNNGFYNASMLMARRAIQQEMIDKNVKGSHLYAQIESTDVSQKLKNLLHKVKNFGNFGAHPDFSLYDEKGTKITNKKDFAKLSLNFLDKYFSDEYETEFLTKGAPKSKKELEDEENSVKSERINN